MLRSVAFFIVICAVVGGVPDKVGINSHLVKANDVVTTETFSTASAQTANETELSVHIAVPETTLTPDQKANVLVIIRNDGRRSMTLKDLGAVNFVCPSCNTTVRFHAEGNYLEQCSRLRVTRPLRTVDPRK